MLIYITPLIGSIERQLPLASVPRAIAGSPYCVAHGAGFVGPEAKLTATSYRPAQDADVRALLIGEVLRGQSAGWTNLEDAVSGPQSLKSHFRPLTYQPQTPLTNDFDERHFFSAQLPIRNLNARWRFYHTTRPNRYHNLWDIGRSPLHIVFTTNRLCPSVVIIVCSEQR